MSDAYLYNVAGRLAQATLGGSATDYAYDEANRLTQASDGTTTTTYAWNTAEGWRSSQGPSGTSPAPITFGYTAT